MSFASANRAGLSRVKEVTWGVTPASPVLIPTRYTGESLDDGITTETSKEIRADRMVSDLIITDAQVTGDFNFELSYESFEDLFESAAMSTYAAAVPITGTIAATVEGFTDSGNGLAALLPGMYFQTGGFATPGNNGYFQVLTSAAGVVTTSPAPAGVEAVGAGKALTIGKMVKNGITEQSYTLVQNFADATTPTRRHFYGMRVKGFSLDMKTASLLTGKFSFIGARAEYTVTPFSGETTAAETTTDILNCVSNVQSVLINGAVLGSPGSVMSATIDFDNQHRAQKGLGILGNAGVVASQLTVKVTASQYFESKTQADMFKNSTAFSFAIVLKDNAGNTMVLAMPRCKYDSFKVNSGQLDSDVMASTTFQALRHPATNSMFMLFAFPATP